MEALNKLLSGGDLRSSGRVNDIIPLITTQDDFDRLFQLLHHYDRLVVMRAADAIEKITANNPDFLSNHGADILSLCRVAVNKELKWHLAQLLSRLNLNHDQMIEACSILHDWIANKKNSRIVRVNALQSLFEMADNKKGLLPFLSELEAEGVPSITARAKHLQKKVGQP